MRRTLLISAIFILLSVSCLAQQSTSISDADHTQIIKLFLSDLRLNKRSFLPKEEQRIARLSTENIKSNLVPDKIDGVEIKTRNAQQIEEDKKNNLRHYAFGKFDLNDTRLTVVLFYYAKNFENDQLMKVTVEYEYQKTAGKWKFVSKRPKATF